MFLDIKVINWFEQLITGRPSTLVPTSSSWTHWTQFANSFQYMHQQGTDSKSVVSGSVMELISGS